MTLSDMLPAIKQLSVLEKQKLMQILVKDLAISGDISPLQPFQTYDLPTPYDTNGAGAILMQLAQESADQV